MNCSQTPRNIDDYLDNLLDPETAREWRVHLESCQTCDQALTEAASMQRALAALPAEDPDPGFFDQAIANATRQSVVAAANARLHRGVIAAGFAVVALLASFLIQVQLEMPDPGVAPPDVAMAVAESRTINLVFDSAEALEAVSLTVDLPSGIELASYPGQREVRWATTLQAGKNLLPLQLVAVEGTGGELVAVLRQNGGEKVFNVSIAVQPG